MSSFRSGPSAEVHQEALSTLIANSQQAEVYGESYPLTEKTWGRDLPPHYRGNDEQAFQLAEEYLTSVLPGIDVQPLSNAGTTAIVMRDATVAYKILRKERVNYRNVENEALALSLLSREGIAPRLHVLIDAMASSRVRTADPYPSHIKSEGQRIPRAQGTGSLAVLVTELKDIGDITEVPSAHLGSAFNRFASVALKHRVWYEDCEFHYDRQTGSAVVVDVGGMRTARPEHTDTMLVSDTFGRFLGAYSVQPTFEEIKAALAKNGDLDSLHPLLHEYRERNSEHQRPKPEGHRPARLSEETVGLESKIVSPTHEQNRVARALRAIWKK